MFQLIFTAFGTQFRNADAWRVINNQGRLSYDSGTLDQSLPFLVIHLPRTQLLGIHIGFHGKHTVHKLFLAHLQAEDSQSKIFPERHMMSDIQLKSRLPHGRTGRDQDQVRGLHPRRTVVKIQKSRGNSRDTSLILRGELNLVHCVHDYLSDRHISIGASSLHQLENTFFRIF